MICGRKVVVFYIMGDGGEVARKVEPAGVCSRPCWEWNTHFAAMEENLWGGGAVELEQQLEQSKDKISACAVTA